MFDSRVYCGYCVGMSTDTEHEDWTPEQWRQWEADADQRDIEGGQADATPAVAPSGHGVMPGGVHDIARRLAAATTEAAVERIVGSPL